VVGCIVDGYALYLIHLAFMALKTLHQKARQFCRA
jgi:hypothetical protein